jgi:hypothetical protein
MDSFRHVIDLALVGAVVGGVRYGTIVPSWGIIDQSGELARAVFTDSAIAPPGPDSDDDDD